jgi:hypothetical protein
MTFDVGHLVGAPDDAVGVDEKGESLRHHRPLLVRPLGGTERLTNRFVPIGQEAVGEALGLGEGLVLLGRVERDAEDLGVQGFELWGSVTEPPAFDRSAGRRGFRVPPEHDPSAAEVARADAIASMVGKVEVRRDVTVGEHEPTVLLMARSVLPMGDCHGGDR